ncbi:D-amino-acid transaminase [Bacillus massiliigorillae]|uniref:D-amino-acid transaminase n=1 Tax=Bacillus massiliigorillae TaxID=1243664 RepID=UPI0003A1006B|nr:D-amino-acid transaminase [Bacillus massiliigorillae]
MKVIWQGNIVDRMDVHVDIEDRGYQFGDGIYEVIRVYKGCLFTGKEHINRLYESASKVRLHIPYSFQQMVDMLTRLVKENELQNGSIYVQVTRGVSPRNHLFPPATVETILSAYTKEFSRPVETIYNGVKAKTVEDIRWLKCDVKSLNLLGNVLAKQSAYEAGCFEAIQHRIGMVTEGSASNIAIVVDGKVKTHPANHLILNGIVRQVMLQTCVSNHIQVDEAPFTLEDLMRADEIFMTSTTSEITPIVEVDGTIIGNGMPGPITKKLQSYYEEEIKKQCGSYCL